MAAYIIVIRESKIHDPAEYAAYRELAVKTRAGHTLRALAMNGFNEGMEGGGADGVTLLEFPTLEAAKAWYDSDAYRAAREHRFKGADYRAFITEGL